MSKEDFVQRVNERCLSFLETKRDETSVISPHATELIDTLSGLASGGKKLRPLLSWVGWRAASGDAESPAVVDLGVALELFQAAALIHDDVIDRSATRRGQPSAHRRFEALHSRHRFSGDTEHFGTSGAILTGDLALAWSQEAYELAVDAAEHPQPDGLKRFRRMHTEVITGQYLDVRAEVAAGAGNEADALAQARAVLTYKSAKYSTEHPLVLGAALAGAPPELVDRLIQAALPVGMAFQLRDDVLGVFGDPQLTGKPVGDDLRAGKRTELVAYGLFRSPPSASKRLSGMLGRQDLDASEVADAKEILTDSGALAAVESEIESLSWAGTKASEDLQDYGVAVEVLDDLAAVRHRLTSRTG